jgi:hypothetical protein
MKTLQAITHKKKKKKKGGGGVFIWGIFGQKHAPNEIATLY